MNFLKTSTKPLWFKILMGLEIVATVWYVFLIGWREISGMLAYGGFFLVFHPFILLLLTAYFLYKKPTLDTGSLLFTFHIFTITYAVFASMFVVGLSGVNWSY